MIILYYIICLKSGISLIYDKIKIIVVKVYFYKNIIRGVFMLDLLMNRRSIRKYKDKAIEKDKIQKLLKGVLTSPSGRNIRPWELIIVDDKDKLALLGASEVVLHVL